MSYDAPTTTNQRVNTDFCQVKDWPEVINFEDPIILLDLSGAVNSVAVEYHLSTEDYVTTSGLVYKAGILNDIDLKDELADCVFGIQQTDPVSIELTNVDDGFNDTWDEIIAAMTGTEDLRGWDATLWIKTTIDGIRFAARGKITQYSITNKLRISIDPREDIVFDTLLPKGVITADEFHATALDIGSPKNICFGYCRNVQCYNIQNYKPDISEATGTTASKLIDTTATFTTADVGKYAHHIVNKTYALITALDSSTQLSLDSDIFVSGDTYGIRAFDYLVGYGPVQDVWTDDGLGVKRDGVLVSTDDYVFYDGSQSYPYAGYSFVRFPWEQLNFSGGYHSISIDVVGLLMGDSVAERNGVEIIRNILSDTTWGLSDSVNTASFDAAALVLPSLPELVLYEGEIIGNTGTISTAETTFTARNCTGLTKQNGSLLIDIKCSDWSKRLDSPPTVLCGLEITSSGSYDCEEWGYNITLLSITDEWQTFKIPLSDCVTTGGELNVSEIDYIRVYGHFSPAQTLSWRNARLCGFYNIDGAITSQTASRDYVNELLDICQASLNRNRSGEWEITIDYEGRATVLALNENNFEVEDVYTTDIDSCLMSGELRYYWSAKAPDTPSRKISMDVHTTFGKPGVFEYRFVKEESTARKILSYKYGREIYSEGSRNGLVSGFAGIEARKVKVNDIVTLTDTARGITAQSYVVMSTDYSPGTKPYAMVLRKYSASIYSPQTISSPASTEESGLGTGRVGSDTSFMAYDEDTKTFDIKLKSGETLALGGNLAVTGSITLGVNGYLGTTGKTSFADTDTGVFLGHDAGEYKLNIGDDTSFLKYDGESLSSNYNGIVNMSAQGGCNVGKTSDQSIPARTFTTIQWDSEDWDTQNEMSLGTYRYTLAADSKVSVCCNALSQAKAWTFNQEWEIAIYVNGAQRKISGSQALTNAGDVCFFIATIAASLLLDAGDYVELKAYHTFTSAVNLRGSDKYTFASFQKLA